MALDACAAYGPGFTSVESGTRCVRIGGHVRVERGYYRYDVGRTAADVHPSDFAGPRHLRVDSGERYGYDPFVQPAVSSKTAQ